MICRWVTMVALAFAVLASLGGAVGAGELGRTGWVMTDLGTFGGRQAEPTGINDSGQIVAFTWSEHGGPGHAYLVQDRRTTDLGEVDSTVPKPVLINNRGEVVLNLRNGHAVLWRNGVRTDLGALGPDGMTRAKAINDRGEVVGWSRTPARRQHAFVWRDGTMTDLGLWGWRTSWAVAINDNGQAVGWRLRRGTQHVLQPSLQAILWQNGKQIDLGALAGKKGADPVALNDRGVVVGSANTTGWDGRWHAFRWEKRAIIDLGTPNGMVQSWASGLNERGQIIGTGATSSSPYDEGYRQRAFLWENGRMTELGVPRPQTQSRAVAINERGQIILESFRSSDFEIAAERAVVWENGKTTDLGAATSAVALNNRGQIVGTVARSPSMDPHVAVWKPFAG